MTTAEFSGRECLRNLLHIVDQSDQKGMPWEEQVWPWQLESAAACCPLMQQDLTWQQGSPLISPGRENTELEWEVTTFPEVVSEAPNCPHFQLPVYVFQIIDSQNCPQKIILMYIHKKTHTRIQQLLVIVPNHLKYSSKEDG